MKVCVRCSVEKTREEYPKRGSGGSTCKKCWQKRIAEWAKENPDKRKKVQLRYIRTEEGRVKRREYARRVEVKEKTKLRKANRKNTVSGRYATFRQWLRNHYKIDVETWARMFNEQNQRCACCQKLFSLDRSRDIHVDHNHTTGAVRSLLCSLCNTMLGYARETPAILRAGANYLEKHIETNKT